MSCPGGELVARLEAALALAAGLDVESRRKSSTRTATSSSMRTTTLWYYLTPDMLVASGRRRCAVALLCLYDKQIPRQGDAPHGGPGAARSAEETVRRRVECYKGWP